MQRQNVEQAEQLVAEVLVAACLAVGPDEGSAKDRRVVRELLRCAFEALCAKQITVHAQMGGEQSSYPVPRMDALLKSTLRHF